MDIKHSNRPITCTSTAAYVFFYGCQGLIRSLQTYTFWGEHGQHPHFDVKGWPGLDSKPLTCMGHLATKTQGKVLWGCLKILAQDSTKQSGLCSFDSRPSPFETNSSIDSGIDSLKSNTLHEHQHFQTKSLSTPPSKILTEIVW